MSLDNHSFFAFSSEDKNSLLRLMSYRRLLATVERGEPSWVSLLIKKRMSKQHKIELDKFALLYQGIIT